MIIDHERKIVIATSPKCGTFTLEHMAERVGGGAGWGVVVTGVNRHSLVVPDGCEDFLRAQTVRNPWARMVSIWAYIGNPAAIRNKEWRAEEIAGLTFPEFMGRWFHWRNELGDELWSWNLRVLAVPHRWLLTLTELTAVFRPIAMIQVEHISAGLAALGLDYGKEYRSNTTKKHRGPWESYYTPALYRTVGEAFAFAEARRFGYKRPVMETLGSMSDRLIGDVDGAQ